MLLNIRAVFDYLNLSHNTLNIRIEDSKLYLFLFFRFRMEFSMILHMTVTNCHKS